MTLKHSFFVLSACILMSCHSEPVSETPVETPKASAFSILAPLFKDLTINDPFFVDVGEEGKPDYAFEGREMDSVQVLTLIPDLYENYTGFKNYYACYKFPIDPSHVGLIVSSPGENNFTGIDLFVFNVKADSVVHIMPLSLAFGDVGEAMGYKACLFRDQQKRLNILKYDYTEYDRSVDNENDTIVEEWSQFSLISLVKPGGDTLSRDSAAIHKQYPEMVRKLNTF